MTEPTDQKRATAAVFNDAAAAYLDSDVHGRGQDLELIATWCRGATRALDIATGAGHTAGALANEGVPFVVAADAAPRMVQTATGAFENLRGVVADADRLPFATNAFDAVTCRIAAHHFPDPEAFLAEVARVIQPGGIFAFEDNVSPEDATLERFINHLEGTRDPTHVNAYTTETWHDWLDDAGFAVEETTHMKKTLEFTAWVDTQSLPAADQAIVADILRDAPDTAKSFFDVKLDDGDPVSFANLKAVIHATRRK